MSLRSAWVMQSWKGSCSPQQCKIPTMHYPERKMLVIQGFEEGLVFPALPSYAGVAPYYPGYLHYRQFQDGAQPYLRMCAGFGVLVSTGEVELQDTSVWTHGADMWVGINNEAIRLEKGVASIIRATQQLQKRLMTHDKMKAKFKERILDPKPAFAFVTAAAEKKKKKRMAT